MDKERAKRYLKIAAVMAGMSTSAMSAASCTQAETPTPFPTPRPAEYYQLIPRILYRAPGTGSLIEKATHEIQSSSGIRTLVFNYTDFSWDPEITAGVYNYLETTINDDSPLQLYPFNWRGGERYLKLVPYKEVYTRVMYVIPQSVPYFFGRPTADAATSFFYQDDNTLSAITYLSVDSIPNQLDAAVFLAIEACQQTFKALPVASKSDQELEKTKSEGEYVRQQSMKRYAQEAACNGIGYALGYRMLDEAYSEYRKAMASIESKQWQMLVVDENTYACRD